MRRGVFVCGTDTGAGKTLLSAGLVLALKERGLDTGYLKPVGTEAEIVDGRMVNPDALWIKELAGLPDPAWRLNPFCLEAPLSPLAASRLEDHHLAWDEMVEVTTGALERHVFTVMEGAGGLLVPLCPEHTMLDLIKATGLPCLIAARGGLGTINHTLLSIQALAHAEVEVLGFCLTSPQPAQPGGRGAVSNSDLIQEYSGARFLGELPWLEGDPPRAGEILAAVSSALDLVPLMT